MRTKRTYKLMRVFIKRFGMVGRCLVFDFWNYQENTGYEVHVIIYHDINKAWRIASSYLGQTHTIVAWDELITYIKADMIRE